MRVTHIASATVLVEHNGVSLLCDPWLVDGAYGGAWYHWPPLTVRPEDFNGVDAIFLSHVHPDHASLRTLARMRTSIPVYIGSYQEPFLRRNIEKLGFVVHEVAPDEPVSIYRDIDITHLRSSNREYLRRGPIDLQIIPADNCDPVQCGAWIGCAVKDIPNKSAQIDSLAVISGGGQRVLNVNDCPYTLSKAALDRVLADGPIDLLLTGYAGAGPWPQCFDLPYQHKLAAAQAKRRQFLWQMQAFVEHVQPRAYVPFAGQYVLGGRLFDLNAMRGVPEVGDLVPVPGMVRLNRGAWIDVETGEVSEPWIDPPRWETAREALIDQPLDHDADPEPSDLHELMLQAQAAWPERVAKRGMVNTWTIDALTERGQWRIASPDESQGTLEIRLDAKLLRRVLTRQQNMNNVEVGSLATFKRTPERFDRGLFQALAYFHA